LWVNLNRHGINTRKIVFSRPQTDIKGRNLEVGNGDLMTAIQRTIAIALPWVQLAFVVLFW